MNGMVAILVDGFTDSAIGASYQLLGARTTGQRFCGMGVKLERQLR
jgi:hypothetical protein